MHPSPSALVAATLVLVGSLAPSLPLPPFAPSGAPVAAPGDLLPGPPGLASPCPVGAPRRFYDISAIDLPISYNHWGDWDPNGTIFVLDSQELNVRLQVAAELAKAGSATAAQVVADPKNATRTLGINGINLRNFPTTAPLDVSPLVEPLVVRAHLGECVEFNLTNKMLEPVGLHVHGLPSAAGQGMDLGTNGDDLAEPLETRRYTVYVPDVPGVEGAHFFHSHADMRFQTKHGLFGALVAEPAGTSWRSPADADVPIGSGTQAILIRPGGVSYREFVVIYHDEVELLDRHQNPLIIVSPYGEYGPGTKAINYRTEPFMDRFDLHDQLKAQGKLPRGHDKSQGYGSYTYGDPATFIPRSYVGEPTKMRLLNAGPGQHHVHHLHGGGDRWRASPVADDTQFDEGLLKKNPVVKSASERIDVQNIGPGESFNAEIEGGAGGVQQSAGDFLFHCHIAEHYVAGMFSFWRVYNALQDDLDELPDRVGLIPSAVNSTGLLGKALPDGTVLNETNLGPWVEAQLPSPGVPGEDDASVWDWTVEPTPEGPLYQGEPETEFDWPNYHPQSPGKRPELEFNPDNGRLAYPFLRPHLGKRPPFAPDHGPAPYLTPDVDARHPDGLCPAGAPGRSYQVVALSTAVTYDGHGDVDPDGQIFVHAADKAAILNGSKPAKSLLIRANQGDCVDVLLSSQLAEAAGEHSKVNMHIHLVQFDVQASDGVITGRSFEQSVRPAPTTGTSLSATALAGVSSVQVTSAGPFRVNTTIGIGLTQPGVEVRRIAGIAGTTLTLDAPLASNHTMGERVGYEFVRYRWYADVDLGMVYWHDHVDGLNSWRHGLFGGLVVEPAGSEWRDPKTGLHRDEGHVVDIVGANGTFREFVVQFQERSACFPPGPDDPPCPLPGDLREPLPRQELATFNLRGEPFHERSATHPLSSLVGNASNPGTPQGDPATDLWRAYPGDPVVVRLLYASQSSTRAVNTFAITGHRFPFEANLTGSRTIDSVSFGISSQHNLRLECGAGGCAKQPGDYLYYITQPEVLRRGAWGVFRVHDSNQTDLLTLPTNANPAGGTLSAAATRQYDVVALEATVTFNEEFNRQDTLKIFALAEDEADIVAGALNPMPLVLRALPDEVVEVNVTNRLDEPVSLSPALLLSSPGDGLGIRVGVNADDTVAPGANRTYRWVADRELGVAYLTSLADPLRHAYDGLYGALVVEPDASTFDAATGRSANVTLDDGTVVREHVLLYAGHEFDAGFESSAMPYTVDLFGGIRVNYREESLNDRVGGVGTHSCQVNAETCTETFVFKPVRREDRNEANPHMFNSTVHGDPETPLLDAAVGQRVALRVVGGAGDQLQVHHVSGHAWPRDRDVAGSHLIDADTIGPRDVSNDWFTAGPGGPGDYWWGTHRGAFQEAGAWGLLRVS